MIRSFILGLSLIFFAMSVFITFKAIVSPDYYNDYQYHEPEITFFPPPMSGQAPPIAPPDSTQTFIAESETDKAFTDDLLAMPAQQIEDRPTTAEHAPTGTQSTASHNLPKTLAVFDGKTFRSGQDIVQGIEYPIIENLIKEISLSPGNRILIEGHTDNTPTGRSSGNFELSLQRAKSIANILISHGIPSSRISVHGFGDTRPIDTNNTEEGRIRNRRVEVILTSKEGDN